MKRLYYFIFASILFCSTELLAIGPLDFGIKLGLSTPNDEISNVFNADRLQIDSLNGDLLLGAMSSGYHLGARVRFNLPLSDLSVVGGIGFHRFPQTNSNITIGQDTYEFGTSLNIIPITLDAQYQLFDLKLVKFYVQGGLSMNQIVYSVDYNNIPIPLQSDIPSSGTDNRFGVGFGGGFDISLALLSINVYADYSITNMINADENEESKRFLALGVGVWF